MNQQNHLLELVASGLLSLLCLLSLSGCEFSSADTSNDYAVAKRMPDGLGHRIDPSKVVVLRGAERARYLDQATLWLEAMETAALEQSAYLDVADSTVVRDLKHGLVWIQPSFVTNGDQLLQGAVSIHSRSRVEAFITQMTLDPSGQHATIASLRFDDDIGHFVPWKGSPGEDSCASCIESTSYWMGLVGDLALLGALSVGSVKVCAAAVGASSLTGPGAATVGIACFVAFFMLTEQVGRRYHEAVASYLAPAACKFLRHCGQGAGSVCFATGPDRSDGWRPELRANVVPFEAVGSADWRLQRISESPAEREGIVYESLDYADVFTGSISRTDAEKLWMPRWWRAQRSDSDVHQQAEWVNDDKSLHFKLQNDALSGQPSFTLSESGEQARDLLVTARCEARYTHP